MHNLLEIMSKLRRECPWDRAQTPESLTQYAIEEAYEVEAAIRSKDTLHIQEELGDLLLQVIFQSEMYAEQGAFNFQDVVDGLKEKLIRRHPHIFDSDKKDFTEQQVSELWQQIKQQEKEAAPHKNRSRLDKVKVGSSIMQAQTLQSYAADLKFDWDHVDGAWQKLDEEVAELKEAIAMQDETHIAEELGDCLFSLINVGRKLDQSCEQALLGTVHKFRQRFAYIEQQLALTQRTPEQCDLSELDQLWNEAKKDEKSRMEN